MTKRDKHNYKSFDNRKRRESYDVSTYPIVIDDAINYAKYFLRKYLNRNVINYVKIMITYIGRLILPIVINIYDLYQKQVPKYFKDPKNGKIDILDTNTNEKHRYFGFIMLLCEIYSLFFQNMIMRLWIIANFAATFLFMYQDLNEDKKNNNIIRYYLFSVIISGLILLLFFTSSIGLTSIPLMIYLINRTIRNMLDECDNIKEHKEDNIDHDKDKEDRKEDCNKDNKENIEEDSE